MVKMKNSVFSPLARIYSHNKALSLFISEHPASPANGPEPHSLNTPHKRQALADNAFIAQNTHMPKSRRER